MRSASVSKPINKFHAAWADSAAPILRKGTTRARVIKAAAPTSRV